MWNLSIQTDHFIKVRRPDLVVVDKKRRTCKIIDFAVPGYSSIEKKGKEKIEKFQDLRKELQKIIQFTIIRNWKIVWKHKPYF